jgi:hypothetical protein
MYFHYFTGKALHFKMNDVFAVNQTGYNHVGTTCVLIPGADYAICRTFVLTQGSVSTNKVEHGNVEEEMLIYYVFHKLICKHLKQRGKARWIVKWRLLLLLNNEALYTKSSQNRS